jgi:hypothetical protein
MASSDELADIAPRARDCYDIALGAAGAGRNGHRRHRRGHPEGPCLRWGGGPSAAHRVRVAQRRFQGSRGSKARGRRAVGSSRDGFFDEAVEAVHEDLTAHPPCARGGRGVPAVVRGLAQEDGAYDELGSGSWVQLSRAHVSDRQEDIGPRRP